MTKKQQDDHNNILFEEEAVDQEEQPQTALSEIEELQAKCQEYKIGWQRAQADYQNFKKETEEKRGELMKWCQVQVLEEVIPVYDNFKKANAHKPESDDKLWKNWAQGIDFIMKQFADILANHKIEEIKTVEEQFNIEQHEAVGEEESDDHEENVIIREVDAGYLIDGKVIKPAKVIIAKAKNQ